MITYDGIPTTEEERNFDFRGLSTDTKPTGEYNGLAIKNGSTFFEIDTQTVKFYDADSETWV